MPGDIRADVIRAAHFPHRFNGFLNRNHIVMRSHRIGAVHQVFRLKIAGLRQQQIRIHRAGRHMVFNHDNGFTQRFIRENLSGAVRFAVLIQQGITGLVEKQLNSGF